MQLSCLEPDLVTRLFANRLSTDERSGIDVHVDGCVACRQVIAGVARGHSKWGGDGEPAKPPATATEPGPATHHVVLHPGEQVSRYLIEGFLGAGAMGAVYEARDPELDRLVALKIVPVTSGSESEGRAGRLVREAQAMARLSHPNIVPVFDAGKSGEIAFIAMQRIDGVSLRVHLATVRSSLSARLRLLCAAGRGLAAAHDAGIVHRDLKPDNILIDRSGVALVGDFGLARLPGEQDQFVDEAVGETGAIADWHTADGVVLGTPAYMSPEVKRGESGGALADQFSFAVTLAEAFGGRPGDLRALQELPLGVRRVVRRALSNDPRNRYPSMTALVDALEPHVTVGRVAIALGVIAVFASVVAVSVRAGSKDVVTACRSAGEDRLHREWTREERGAVEVHLVGLSAPGGALARTAVERLDRYATEWLAMRQDVCAATDVRGEQTTTLRDLRMSCLDDRLVELATVRRTLGSLTHAELAAAPGITALLGDLAQCADSRSLERRTPTDPIAVAKARALKGELVEASATIMRGRLAELTGGVAGGYEDAELIATRVIAEARAARLPVIEADALRIRANLVGRGAGAGNPTGYYESLAIGERLADPALRADALVGLLQGAAHDPARAGEVTVVARLLENAISELPEPQHERRARLSGNLADFHKGQGELSQAEQLARDAVAHFDAARGRGDPYSLNARQVLASILFARKKLVDARQVRSEMIDATREAFGQPSPELVLALVDEGKQLARAGLLGEARASLERALAGAEALHGADDAQVALILRTLGFVVLDTDPAAARTWFTRAVSIVEREGKPVQLAPILLGLGEAELGTGDAVAAIPHLEHGLTLLGNIRSIQQLSPPALFALARARWQTGGDHRAARELATRARLEFRTIKGSWEIDEVTREVSTWLEAHPVRGEERDRPAERTRDAAR